MPCLAHESQLNSSILSFYRLSLLKVRVTHATLERRLVGISLSERRQRNLHKKDIRAQSNVRDPPIRHQEKEAWMGRTHNAKKRWQMDEANARLKEISLYHGDELKTHNRQGPKGLDSCDPRPHQMIEEQID
uniref:Uncharacterized protein n=1 Tax=Caenorhabditis japonica TaxID=281687 RepID=A0A8R1I5D0_CAEJA